MPGRRKTAAEPLEKYRSMRDFSKTPEPAGDPGDAAAGKPRFVIQEHHATALHWDFRLEHAGVLASWAVPKGIPVDPASNHLAVQTEDHPLEYYDFEGDIPEAEYGGGKVFLWDRGWYETHKYRPDEVMVTLHGERARGKYVLFRTGGKNWMIHRMDPPEDPNRDPMPSRIQPMLAKLAKMPADHQRYAFEVKWDGVRAVAYCSGGRLHLESRNLLELTAQFPELRAMAEGLGAHEVVLDGEVVAFDAQGRPSFERLQSRLGLNSAAVVRRRMAEVPVVFVLFDLLYLDGHSTMALPYTDRRKLLESL
ncbi:MAG: DNA polymerase ligase N-terminal domain-containing protein, partial [Dehalococcoidia bacterium]